MRLAKDMRVAPARLRPRLQMTHHRRKNGHQFHVCPEEWAADSFTRLAHMRCMLRCEVLIEPCAANGSGLAINVAVQDEVIMVRLLGTVRLPGRPLLTESGLRSRTA